MRMKHLSLLFPIILLIFDSCETCRNLPKADLTNFEITYQGEKSTLHLEENTRVKLTVHITPKNELAKGVPYYELLGWETLAGLKGQLFGAEGEKITGDTKLKNGDNIFFYEPKEMGEHTIKLRVADKYHDLQQEIVVPFMVEKLPTPFFKVSLQATPREIFTHQTATIELEISSDDTEASGLAYTIQEVEISQGALHLAGGEEVQVGSTLVFGQQSLTFKPTEQVGTTKIKLRVSSGKGERSVSLVIEVKAFSFQPSIWFREPTEEEKKLIPNNFAVLEAEISGVDKELVNEAWKIATWKFSDGVAREIVDQDLKQLKEFPIKIGQSNKYYLKLPDIKLDQEPTLSMQVEGPGKVTKEVTVPLAPIQKAIVAKQEKQLLGEIQSKIREVNNYLRSPVQGRNYSKLQEVSMEAVTQLDKLKESITNLQKRYSGVSEQELEKLKQEVRKFEEDIAKLSVLKEECAKKQFSFQAELKTSANTLLNHKHLSLPLAISSDEEIAAGLTYTIQQIEVTKGKLEFVSGEEANVSSKLIFGNQNLVFRPTGETGQAKIKLTVENNKGATSSTGVVLDIKPVSFKTELKADIKDIFIHQTGIVTLDITSADEGAAELDYTVKKLEVTNGELYYGSSHQKISTNSKVMFGWHNLIFKPTGEIKDEDVKATIKLTIDNGKGVESTSSMVFSIKPIHFKVGGLLREVTEEEKKIMTDDFGVVEVSLAGVDQELVEENWKIAEWKFSDGVARTILDKDLKQSLVLPLNPTVSNKLYLTLPDIKLNKEPTLILRVEGPGKVSKEVTVPLAPIQKAIVAKQEKQLLEEIQSKIREANNYLRLPVQGRNHSKLQEVSMEAVTQLNKLKESITNLQKRYSGMSEQELEKLKQEVRKFEEDIAKLNTLKEECEKKQFSFQAELKTSANTIFNHKNLSLPLAISSDEEIAAGLTYTIKQIEITKGKLQFVSGEEVNVSSKLIFGNQNLVFRPIGEIGQARIKLTVENNKGATSSTGVVLDIKPVSFKTELKADVKNIFIHQTGIVTLDITSTDEGAADLDYTVKKLEVTNGELYYGSSHQKINANSKVMFGWHNFIFKPTGEVKNEDVKATIKLTIDNGKGVESTSSMVFSVKPIHFKAGALLREATGEEKKVISGDFGVVEVSLAGMDKELVEENWKISEWKFSDGVERTILNKDLKQSFVFSLNPAVSNKLYLTLPGIKLDREPTLILRVEGPGKVTKEVTVPLATVQIAIVAKKVITCLASTVGLAKRMDSCLLLPISGVNYNLAKELGIKADKQIAAVEDTLTSDVKSVLPKECTPLIQELQELTKRKDSINAFKEACDKKRVSFQANLDTSSKELFAHQSGVINLELTTAEEEAKGLAYTVKQIEVTKGELFFEKGGKLKVGSGLVFGTQKLGFKPSGDIGKAKIKLTVENNKGATSSTMIVIEVKPISFQVDMWAKESTEEDKKIIPGNVGVVEIKLSDLDKTLIEEDWKISEWKFSDGDQSAHPSSAIQKVDLSIVEESKEKQIKNAISKLSNKMTSAEKELRAAEKELKSAKEEVERIKKEMESTEKEVKDDLSKERAAQEKLNEDNEKLKVAEEQLKPSQEQVRKSEKEFKIAEEGFKKAEQNKQSYEKGFKEAQEKLKADNEKLKLAKKELEKIEERKKQFEEEERKAIDKVETLKKYEEDSNVKFGEVSDLMKKLWWSERFGGGRVNSRLSGYFTVLSEECKINDPKVRLLERFEEEIKVFERWFLVYTYEKCTNGKSWWEFKTNELELKGVKIEKIKNILKDVRTSLEAVIMAEEELKLAEAQRKYGLEESKRIKKAELELEKLRIKLEKVKIKGKSYPTKIVFHTIRNEDYKELEQAKNLTLPGLKQEEVDNYLNGFKKAQQYLKENEEEDNSLSKSMKLLQEEIEKKEKELKESRKALEESERHLKLADEKVRKTSELSEEKVRASEKEAKTAEERFKKAVELVGACEKEFKVAQGKLKESNEKLKLAEEQLKTSQEQVKKSEKELKAAEEKRRSSEIGIDKLKSLLKTADSNLRIAEEKAKKSKELFEVQKSETESKIQDLQVDLEIEKKLQEVKTDLQALKPILLTKELEELSRISITSKDKSRLYVKFPTITLGNSPKLVVKVEGPGKASKEVTVQLQDLQRTILTKKMSQALDKVRKISKEIDECRQLPISGNNYSQVKSFMRDSETELREVFNDLEASCGNKWWENPVILSLSPTQDIVREMSSISKHVAKLKDLKKTCKKKGVTFEAGLHVSSRSLFTHQPTPVILEITSNEKGAEGLEYIIKKAEVTKGELFFDNTNRVIEGNKLKYGKQNLLFKPIGQEGEAKIKLAISNGKGGESSTGIILEISHVNFHTELHTASKNLFAHQTTPVTLEISSNEIEASKLEYTVKELKVKNGSLSFNGVSQVGKGSKLKYGKQELVFKPTVREGEAAIHIVVDNGKGNNTATGIVLEIQPVNFSIDAWLSEPRENENKLLQGEFAVLDIVLSGVDPELARAPWKLIGWAFDKDPAHSVLSRLAPSMEFDELETSLGDLLIENGSEKKIQLAIQEVENKKQFEKEQGRSSQSYGEELTKKANRDQKSIGDIEGGLKRIEYKPSMDLVTLHEARSKEKIFNEEKRRLGLEVRSFSREVELQNKRVQRDIILYEINKKQADAKLEKLRLALEVKRQLRGAQQFASTYSSQPTLVDSSLNKLTMYNLKVGENNKFYVMLPNLGNPLALTLQVEGPGKVVQEVGVQLFSVLYPIAASKAAKTLEKFRNLSNQVDTWLNTPVEGKSYDKLKEFSRNLEPQLKNAFKELEASYGQEWWKNPILLSLKDVENIVDEIIVLKNKREKLDALRKACRKRKVYFQVDARFKLPEGEKIMGADYAVLKIKLLDVDESITGENWKLLGWKCSDFVPRVIVDKGLNELHEFPLSVKAENELYLKFSVIEMIKTPTMSLQIGVAGKTEQEVVLELGPIQNALAGGEISKFLEVVQKLNEEINNYLNMPVRDRKYDRLLELLNKAGDRINFYKQTYAAVKKTLQSDPKGLAKILPGTSARDLVRVIESEIPLLDKNKKRLDTEFASWNDAIKEFLSIERSIGKHDISTEEVVASIYTPNKDGDLLIHRWLSSQSKVSPQAATFIIQKTMSLDVKNKEEYVPLTLAIKNEDLEVTKELLNNGASPHTKFPAVWYSISPLVYAIKFIAERGKLLSDGSALNFVTTLLDHGADAREFYPKTIAAQQISVIMGVMINDSLGSWAKQGMVRKLLDCGAREDDWSPDGRLSKHYQDVYGWGPLFAAIEQDEIEIAEMLLKNNTSGFVEPKIIDYEDDPNLFYLVEKRVTWEITTRYIPWHRHECTYWDHDKKDRWYNLLDRFNKDMDGRLYWKVD